MSGCCYYVLKHTYLAGGISDLRFVHVVSPIPTTPEQVDRLYAKELARVTGDCLLHGSKHMGRYYERFDHPRYFGLRLSTRPLLSA